MDPHVAANRALWNEWTPIHVRSELYDVEGWKSGGKADLYPLLVDEVGDVAGKDLLHLHCHFGLDTLAWARRGARATGIDVSERGIEEARRLSAETGLDATFVVSDVVELPSNLEGDFDVVFTSLGALNWLPDLPRWAEVVAHFTRPGGFFYIAEAHPFAWVFDDDDSATELRVAYRYWPSRSR
jgi:SAM-dependent methyltransferase